MLAISCLRHHYTLFPLTIIHMPFRFFNSNPLKSFTVQKSHRFLLLIADFGPTAIFFISLYSMFLKQSSLNGIIEQSFTLNFTLLILFSSFLLYPQYNLYSFVLPPAFLPNLNKHFPEKFFEFSIQLCC